MRKNFREAAARPHAELTVFYGLLSARASLRRQLGRKMARRAKIRTMAVTSEGLSLAALRMPRSRQAGLKRGQAKAALDRALTFVDHYEVWGKGGYAKPDSAGAKSVGLSYRQIQSRARLVVPGRKISLYTIRSYGRDLKRLGARMPYRRPYSQRFRK